MVLRIIVRGTSSDSPTGDAGAVKAAVPTDSRSFLMIRPAGPLPRTFARSMPFSPANFRASGEALMRRSVVPVSCGSGSAAAVTGAAAVLAGCGASEATGSPTIPEMSSSAPAITAIRVATSTVWPSVTRIRRRTPSARATIAELPGHNGFVGLYLRERISGGNRVSFLLQPGYQSPFFHRGR